MINLSQNHPDCPEFSCWWHWVYHGLPCLGRTPLYLWAIAHSIASPWERWEVVTLGTWSRGEIVEPFCLHLGLMENLHMCVYTYPWLHTNSIPLNVFCFYTIPTRDLWKSNQCDSSHPDWERFDSSSSPQVMTLPGNSTGKTVTIWWNLRRPTDTALSEYSCPKCTECNYFRWTFRS